MTAQQNPTSTASSVLMRITLEGQAIQFIVDKVIAALGPQNTVSVISTRSQGRQLKRKRTQEAPATQHQKRRSVTFKTEGSGDDIASTATSDDDTASTATSDEPFASVSAWTGRVTMEEALREFTDDYPDTCTGPSVAYLAAETQEEREQRWWNEAVAVLQVDFESWHWRYYGYGLGEDLEAEELLKLAYRMGLMPKFYTTE